MLCRHVRASALCPKSGHRLSLRKSAILIRPQSTKASPTASPQQSDQSDSDSKSWQRLPKWAAKYADKFKNHPTSHITSFLILHELTAALPLPILWWFFHSFDWTPEGLPTETIQQGVEVAAKKLRKWGLTYTGDDGSRYIFEGAAAYAVVKVLFPARIALSLSLTPWFAKRAVVPITQVFRRLRQTKTS